jgi:glycosyltransferase involved in cell wall biosynthesis
VLLEGAAPLLRERPDARLLLVGDGELRGELSTRASALGILSQVLFAGFRDDLDAMFSAMDVYAHPSLATGGESFPLAVVQALGAGLPVIASRVGDVPSMLGDGRHGVLIDADDAPGLASALGFLAGSPAACRELGEAARHFAHESLSAGRMCADVETIYRELSGKVLAADATPAVHPH